MLLDTAVRLGQSFRGQPVTKRGSNETVAAKTPPPDIGHKFRAYPVPEQFKR